MIPEVGCPINRSWFDSVGAIPYPHLPPTGDRGAKIAMGPFSTPWLTFVAWFVAAASVLASLVWAIVGFRSKKGP